MIRSFIATAAVLVGALPRTLRAALGDARDSRQLARAVRTLARQRAALELLAASEQDRADAAERAGDQQERSIAVLTRRAERAEDERDALRRQLQAAEGTYAVQRAEIASIKRDLEVSVRDSLRYQDGLQRIINHPGSALDLERIARVALSPAAPKAPEVAHPPTNGEPR